MCVVIHFMVVVKVVIIEVRDDPKVSDDSGKVSKSNGVFGGSIPNHEIYSTESSQVVKRLLCFPHTRRRKKKKKKKKKKMLLCHETI